jgi:hypothetical protein
MTQVIRLPIVDDASPLDRRIVDLCDTMLAANMRLAAMTKASTTLMSGSGPPVEDQLILVFQG